MACLDGDFEERVMDRLEIGFGHGRRFEYTILKIDKEQREVILAMRPTIGLLSWSPNLSSSIYGNFHLVVRCPPTNIPSCPHDRIERTAGLGVE